MRRRRRHDARRPRLTHDRILLRPLRQLPRPGHDLAVSLGRRRRGPNRRTVNHVDLVAEARLLLLLLSLGLLLLLQVRVAAYDGRLGDEEIFVGLLGRLSRLGRWILPHGHSDLGDDVSRFEDCVSHWGWLRGR